MVGDAVAKKVIPTPREEPEGSRNMRADGGAFWAGCAFTLATLHLLAHFRIHLFQRAQNRRLFEPLCPSQLPSRHAIGIAHGFATLGTIGFEGPFDYEPFCRRALISSFIAYHVVSHHRAANALKRAIGT